MGCLLPTGPDPELMMVQGQLRSATASALAAPVRLAVVWYPSWFGTAEGVPPVVGEVHNWTFDGTFPVDFTVELRGPPPDAALVDLSKSGGSGKAAYGLIVAFEDGNGNGTLDLATSASASPDRIIGTSTADPSLPPPDQHTYVAYLDGTQGKEDYLYAFQPEQGYTLYEVHSDYGVRMAPPGTTASIEVTRTEAVQLFGCAEMDLTWGYRTACGVDPYAGDYRIISALYEHRSATFYVDDGRGPRADATILLNGAALPFDAQSGAYTAEVRPVVGVNTLQVDVPGHPTETISVTVPAPVQFTTSLPAAAQSGTRLTVAWSDDPAIELYDILVYAQDDGRFFFHDLLNENSFTTEPIFTNGVVRVSVLGLAPLAFGARGHWVRPVSRASQALTFQ
jgi:hypothetical protein